MDELTPPNKNLNNSKNLNESVTNVEVNTINMATSSEKDVWTKVIGGLPEILPYNIRVPVLNYKLEGFFEYDNSMFSEEWEMERYILREDDNTLRDLVKDSAKSLKVNPKDINKYQLKDMNADVLEGKVVKSGTIREEEPESQIFILLKDKNEKHHLIYAHRHLLIPLPDKGDDIKICLEKRIKGLQRLDLIIESQAKLNGGVFDAKLHEDYVSKSNNLPPNVSPKDLKQACLKRLAALEIKHVVTQVGDGKFRLLQDFKCRIESASREDLSGSQVKLKNFTSDKFWKNFSTEGVKKVPSLRIR